MDKDRVLKKRMSLDRRGGLPSPPPSPPLQKRSPQSTQAPVYPDAFRRLNEYKKRENEFLASLNEAITIDCQELSNEKQDKIRAQAEIDEITPWENATLQDLDQTDSQQNSPSLVKSDGEQLREECDTYLLPLLNRTGPSISAALVTYDAFDQLTKLHGLLNQLLEVRCQNYQMQKQIRDARTLCELKKLQKKDSLEKSEDLEFSDNELDLSAILAAGNSASTKRSTAKRQRERSKSVIADEIQMFASEKEKTSSLRRQSHQSQSAFSDSKAKISKWTKVKAAFKWERANVATMNEGKSLDSGISLGPLNHEVARYLRVPSAPCAGSSADSVLSSSSGHLLSGGSVPATPGTISSASSIEDVGGASEENRNNRDSSKSDSRCDSRANDEDNRRSRSLDGDTIISSSSLARDGKNKTPWKKVKDIIQTHRGSFKGKSRSRSVKSGETCSRDHSPCESIDALSNADDRNNDHGSSNPASPGNKNTPPSVSVSHESSVFSYSPHGSTSGLHNRDEYEGRHSKSSSRSNRKSRALTDFEVLPEDVIVDLKSTGAIHRGRLPPSPLNLRQDSSDAEYGEMCHSPTLFGKTKLFRSRKALASGNSSVPSSPSRHSEFFGDSDNIFRFPDTNLPSEDFSSGDFSEPPSPHRNNHEKLSPQSSLQIQQKEINEKYYELCEQLAQEFEAKQEEWKKIQAACASNAPTAFQMMTKDESSLATKNVPATLLEENLSPDFKKKLHKWRVKKQNSVTLKDPQISPTKENDQKKIDWNLWKTGQLKLEGQGLTPMPEQKDLSEDFQKKLEQWRKFKESNTVPSYTSQDSLKRSKKARDDSERYDRDKQRPEREKLKVHDKDKLEKLSKLKAMVTDVPAKEIEVKTSKGVMKFEGISRKFTRKLYEWEKAKGIGPESSTFALLHPGYRPLDVGNGSQDNAPQENSPVLGRSLSLDSISPNPSVPSISHQPSSLSLNDMKDSASAADGLGGRDDDDYDKDRQQDEPEAVIVEVEDDIVETAAPLVAAHPMFEHQTPVYKYEVPCTELCSTVAMDGSLYQRTHVSTEALHKVSSLKRLQSQQDEDYREHVVHVQSVLMSLEESLPEVESSIRGNKIQSLETLSSIKRLVRELIEMLCSLLVADRFDSNEFKERSRAIDSKLCSLQANINLVCKTIEAKKLVDPIPAINIISEETNGIGRAIVCVTPTIFHSQVLYEQPQVKISSPVVQEPLSVPAVLDNSRLDPGEGPSKKVNRTTSNSSKKKMRLRKMGSRQNSKTESDSDEDLLNVTLEAPRRVKRKTSKVKRSPDDERKPNIEEKRDENYGGEDIVYILKVKPGQKIEQEVKQDSSSEKNVLISPNELCVELMEAPAEQASSSANIFVKTKRKVFTTVEEVSRVEPKVVVAKELDSSSTSERTSRESSIGDSEKSRSQMPSSLPPIPQSPSTQRRDVKSSSLKEPSPSIRMMIQRYNQTVEKSTKAGSASPIIFRSPVLDRRLAKQNEHVERVVKSSSAGHIQCNDLVAVNIPEADYQPQDPKLPKASSADNLTQNDIDDECTVSSPLAYDSLKASKPKASPIVGAPFSEPEKKEKEHLYKKHKEKPTSLFSKSGAVKKIGLKTGKASENIWRRSISNTPNEPWLLPDKSDNTVPKISRKYESSLEIHAKSAPTTPMTEDFERPKTPLTERALKIQRAKEEFFKRDIQRSSTWETSSTKESTWQKRLSGSSFGSTASNDLQMGALLKSASVGFINTTTNENSSTEDYAISIPRPSEKTSKFGFSSIASKFRKVKMRRGAKEQSAKYNAISTLCRQSLAVVDMHADASAIQEQLKRAEMDKKVVEKSGSSHGLAFLSGLRKLEKLTKSRSANALTQNDKDTKEM